MNRRYCVYGGLEWFYAGTSMQSLLYYYAPGFMKIPHDRSVVCSNIVGTMWVHGEYL